MDRPVTLDLSYYAGTVRVLPSEVAAVARGDNGGAVVYLKSGQAIRVVANDKVRQVEP